MLSHSEAHFGVNWWRMWICWSQCSLLKVIILFGDYSLFVITPGLWLSTGVRSRWGLITGNCQVDKLWCWFSASVWQWCVMMMVVFCTAVVEKVFVNCWNVMASTSWWFCSLILFIVIVCWIHISSHLSLLCSSWANLFFMSGIPWSCLCNRPIWPNEICYFNHCRASPTPVIPPRMTSGQFAFDTSSL